MIIYKVTNKVNGKMYIGQTTTSLKCRRNGHHYKSTVTDNRHKPFHLALIKYGRDNFTWDILCECDSIDELNEKEIFYIDKYNTFNNGYNAAPGGLGTSGYHHTDEAKKKIGLNSSQYKRTPKSNKKRAVTMRKSWEKNAVSHAKAIRESVAVKVYQYDKDMKLVKTWPTETECHNEPGYRYSRRTGKHSKGYLWSKKKL